MLLIPSQNANFTAQQLDSHEGTHELKSCKRFQQNSATK